MELGLIWWDMYIRKITNVWQLVKAWPTVARMQYFSLLHLFLLDSRTPVGFLLEFNKF